MRREVLARRDALPADVRRTLSRSITAHLLGLPAVQTARGVLAYLAFGSEYDTEPLLTELLVRGVRLALPKIDRERRELELFHIGDPVADTIPGVWGIREPSPERCPPAPAETIDVILVPGVAFTSRGERLGYGGGYYDRLLSRWPQPRPLLVAAALSVQLVPWIPTTALDVPVDLVVTEDGAVSR